MSKITEFNVGDTVTRKERAQCETYSDGSYMGTKMKIIELTDEYAQVEFLEGMLEGDTHGFTGPWFEGWTRISKGDDKYTEQQKAQITQIFFRLLKSPRKHNVGMENAIEEYEKLR